jgi:hypothetical protein
VLDFGLFPVSDPSARVIVESSLSPSGYGSRRLTAWELGDLWDVPILLLDSLLETDVGLLMAAIYISPPSKLLHTGADLLLTAVFQGGGVGRAREFSVPPGLHPLSNLELGLSSSTNKRQCVEAPPQDEVSMAEAVIKDNLQKADNASVPDHLWLRVFVVGYEDTACAARHRDALNLPTGDVGLLGASEPPIEWRGAIPGLRLFALRYWRAHTTRGYITWQRTNVLLPAGSGGQMVQYHWQWGSGGERPVYEWTGMGRRRYHTEWQTLRASSEGKATVEAGYDAIHRCADASWFKWPKGLAPLFWNWGPEYQQAVREGQPHFMTGALEEPFLRKQAKAKDPLKNELMRAKVVQVRQRGYITPGHVTSGTHYFCVDKGTLDIRMVYNGTSCGLNACLHALHHGLLLVKHTL